MLRILSWRSDSKSNTRLFFLFGKDFSTTISRILYSRSDWIKKWSSFDFSMLRILRWRSDPTKKSNTRLLWIYIPLHMEDSSTFRAYRVDITTKSCFPYSTADELQLPATHSGIPTRAGRISFVKNLKTRCSFVTRDVKRSSQPFIH